MNPILEETQYKKLSAADVKKIREYYGLAVPAILGEGFCLLRGKPMDTTERYILTCLGAITGLYDDFFDQLDTAEAHIQELTAQPSEKIAQNMHESLFVRLYTSALKYSSHADWIKEKALEVYRAQLLSKKQKQSDINVKEIRSITLFKGGASLLFYRTGLIGGTEKAEEKMLYNLGGLMQLENDIFDIYKDHQDKIATLATTTYSIDDLRTEYKQLHRKTMDLLSKTRFSISRKKTFLRYLNLIIHRGSVCLDCLEENEKITDGMFSIDKYKRQQLICDMEKAGNLYNVFQYYLNSPMPDIK